MYSESVTAKDNYDGKSVAYFQFVETTMSELVILIN